MPWIARSNRCPGSAAHHSAALRAALRPGHEAADAHPGHQRRRHPRAGPEDLRGDRARDLRRRLGDRAGARPVRRVAFAVAQRSAAAAPDRRAPLRGEGHADRLRDHGRAPRAAEAARPRAVRRQPRPQRRRGRALFRHGRGREGGRGARHSVVRAVAGLRLGQQAASRTGRPRSSTRPTSSGACSSRASRATCWSTSTSRIARRAR